MGNAFKLANRVRELRRRLKLRQADLAAEVDVTRQTIIAIEKGKLNPSIFICLKIARVLREPVDYVFFLDRADDVVGDTAAAVEPVEERADFQAAEEAAPGPPEPDFEPAVVPAVEEPAPEPEPVAEEPLPPFEPVSEPVVREEPPPAPEPVVVEEPALSEAEPVWATVDEAIEPDTAEPIDLEPVTAYSGYVSPVDNPAEPIEPAAPEEPPETAVKHPEPASRPDIDVVEDPESDSTSQTVWDF